MSHATHQNQKHKRWIYFLLVSATVAIAFYLFWLADLKNHVAEFLLAYSLLFCVYSLLTVFILTSHLKFSGKLFLFGVAAFGLSAGLFLLMQPTISKDLYRYIWDGMLVSHAVNPYLYLPQDIHLREFQQTHLYQLVDLKNKYTLYPPIAQYIFALVWLLYNFFGVIGGKGLMILPVLLLALIMHKLLPRELFLILILNPLFLFETFYSAHVDAWACFLVVLSILWYRKGWVFASAVALGLGATTKIFPIFFAPLFLVNLIRNKKYTQAFFYSTVICNVTGIAYVPFVKTSFFPLTHYASVGNEFEFNDTIYRYLSWFWPKLSIGIATVFLGILALVVSLRK